MLVLSRKQEEEIVFPELGISVRVLRTKGNQVRLGIKAPSDVRVLRGELAFETDTTLPVSIAMNSFPMQAQAAS